MIFSGIITCINDISENVRCKAILALENVTESATADILF